MAPVGRQTRHHGGADCPALRHDAPAVIGERLPEVAAAFHARGWPLPLSIDRVYDSGAAAAAFGYRPAHGIHHLLGGLTGPGPR